MKTYNKIMQIIWLALGLGVVVIVTIMGVLQGFDRWASYYWLAIIVLGFYFIRRYMMKRMVKHQEFLEKQAREKKEQEGKPKK